MNTRNKQRRGMVIPMFLCCVLMTSCGERHVTDTVTGNGDEREEAVVKLYAFSSLSSRLRGSDGLLYALPGTGIPSAGKAAAIEPPLELSAADREGDNGYHVILTWKPSPSEEQGMVTRYRIFQSRSGTPTEPIPLTRFSSIDSLMSWDIQYTVLMDSVPAATTEYLAFVPVNAETYHFWLQSVYDPGSVSLSGTVTDTNGGPIGGALLRLYNDDGSVDLYTVSEDDGSYLFSDIPPGEYILVVKRDDYVLYSTTVTVGDDGP